MKRDNCQQKNKLHIALILVLILFICFCGFAASPYQIPASETGRERDTLMDPYRILCISSYNYSYPIVPDQLDGLSEGLKDFPADIDYEFMDAKSFYKSEDIQQFKNYLFYRMNRRPQFDLIVLCDDTALNFGMSCYDTLFKDIPILFMGANNATVAQTAAAREHVTGIAETLDFKSNYDLINNLFPGHTMTYLVMDNTNSAQGEFLEFEKYVESLPEDHRPNYTVINTSLYSKKGLERILSEIDPAASLILYLDCVEDGEGNLYTLQSGTKLISDNAPDVPIWRVSLAGIGNGVLGGIAYSYYDAGLNLAEIAKRVLNGTDPDQIPLVTESMTHAYFEQGQMDKYGIRTGVLPKNTIIVNEKQTFIKFYKQNMVNMNIIFLALLLLCVIIIFLVYANHQRTKMVYQDFLTQMPNRFYITQRMATMDDNDSFGLIMMDADHFKNINDTLGHQIGDEILIDIAKRLKSFPQDEVIFARIGGDEFVGLIFHADKDIADRICRELIEKMKEPIHTSAKNITMTISVGAAVYPDDVMNRELVQVYADAALYEVKKKGRNGYRLFEPEYKKNVGKSM